MQSQRPGNCLRFVFFFVLVCLSTWLGRILTEGTHYWVGDLNHHLIECGVDVKVCGVERGGLGPMNQIERFCEGDILAAGTGRTLAGALRIVYDVAPCTIHDEMERSHRGVGPMIACSNKNQNLFC